MVQSSEHVQNLYQRCQAVDASAKAEKDRRAMLDELSGVGQAVTACERAVAEVEQGVKVRIVPTSSQLLR